MTIKLSKRADKLLCLIYKQYLERLTYGDADADARYTGSAGAVKRNMLPGWAEYDVDVALHELAKHNLVYNYETEAGLTDDGIMYMRGRFGNDVAAIVEYEETLDA